MATATATPTPVPFPFPTRDPRLLRIIANVLYALPPAPPADGAQARRPEVTRPARGGEARGDEPRREVPRPARGGDARGDESRVEVPRPGRGEEARGSAPREDVPRPGCGGDGRRFAFAPRAEVPRPGREEEVRGSAPREDVPRPGLGGDGRRLAFAPRAEVPGPGWEGRGVAPRAEVLGPGGEGRGVAPLPQYSSRSGSKILEGLPCLGGQERAAQGPKARIGGQECSAQGPKARIGGQERSAQAIGGTSQYDKDNRVDIPARITSVRLRQGFVTSSLGPGGLLHEEINRNQGRDVGRMPPGQGCTGWADCQAVPTLDAQGTMTIIHDLQFRSISRISEAILNAKGPISLLRLDTILFDSEQLESLFKLLVASKVEEVILVNRTWPEKCLEFPINSIDNIGIVRLRICFFKISEIFASELDNLVLLDIAHCLIKSGDLKDLVLKCKRLRELHLGYHHEDLYLRSPTLVIVQIWYSEMNIIEIKHAPKLRKITVSAVPKSTQKLLLVRIDNSPDLETIVGNISNQAISFRCHDMRKGTSLMPNLKNLYIGVCLSMVNERKYLLNIFKCFNHLKKLALWRMDDVPSTEADDALIDDWSEEIRVCEVVNHLHYLKIEGFKGGEYELAIASGFLKYSSSLRHLLIVSDKEDSLQRARNAFDPPSHVTVTYQKSLVAGI